MIKVAADQKAVQRKKDKEKNMQKNYEATRNCFARSLKKTCQCSQSKRKINEHQTEKELLLTYVLLYLYSDDMSLTYVANNHVRSVYMYYRVSHSFDEMNSFETESLEPFNGWSGCLVQFAVFRFQLECLVCYLRNIQPNM